MSHSARFSPSKRTRSHRSTKASSELLSYRHLSNHSTTHFGITIFFGTHPVVGSPNPTWRSPSNREGQILPVPILLLLIPIPHKPPVFYLPFSRCTYICMCVKGAKRKRWVEERNGKRDGGKGRVGGSGGEREKPDSVGRTFIHQLHSR
jgi:hypothetical protein